MKIVYGLGLVMTAMALSGCTVGLASALQELAKDHASVCINIASIYANVKIARTNIQNGDVNCTQEGMSVKSKLPGPS